MGDEQPPQSDLIDDAIRNAERQLEEKLEALRMSALGEHIAATSSAEDDIAVLRPTNVSPRASASAPSDPSDPRFDADAATNDADTSTPHAAWRETSGDDVTFAPVNDAPAFSSEELYVPDASELERAASDEVDVEPIGETLPPVSSSLSTADPISFEATPSRTVSALSASWDEDEEDDAPDSVDASTIDASWMSPKPRHEPREAARPVMPSEDELQFWAQTRTALRNLQQITDAIPSQVSEELGGEIARIVQEEIAPSAATVRLLHQQLQQGLPKLADRIEESIDQAMTAPANGLRQIRDEMPAQTDRTVRQTREAMREELEASALEIHSGVRNDITQLEQSIATNVTRMAQGTNESVIRVERDVDLLGEGLVRFERGVHSEFDRVEAQLRASIERTEQSIREDLVAPAETVRKLDDELPTRLGRVERTVIDQVQQTQRDLSAVLMTLVDTTQVAVDRLGSLATSVDGDRAQRAEDVELLVDTVTTGWEGLAGAVKALFEQNEEQAHRIAGIEQRLGQLRDLEGTVGESMDEMRRQVESYQQTPVIVSVTHPDAQVRESDETSR